MTTTAKRLLTVAALTNPLVWFAATLAVAVGCVVLGGLVLYGMGSWLARELGTPPRRTARPVEPQPQATTLPETWVPVPITVTDPAVSGAWATSDEPLFGVELPRPTRVTEEQRLAIIAAERGEPASCAFDEAPAVERTRKPRKPAVKRKPTPKPAKKAPAPPAKARTKAKPAPKATAKPKKASK